MDLKHLRYFKAVAEELNFRKAASKLGMSQPPLSQQIKELEESLGTSLFLRLKNENRLTEAGKILYQYTVEIFEIVEAAEEHIKAIREKRAGTISLGLVPGIKPQHIAKTLQQFNKKYPNVDISVSENCTNTLIQNIKGNQIDLAVAFGPVQDEEIEWAPLDEESYQIVVPKNHGLSKRKTISVKDILHDPIILYKRHDQPYVYDRLIKLFRDCGAEPKIVSELSSPRTRVLLVHQGMGITFAPASLKDEYPNVLFKSFVDFEPVALGVLRKRSKHGAIIREMVAALENFKNK